MPPLWRAYATISGLSLRGDVVAIIFVFGWLTSSVAVEVAAFQFGRLTANFYALLPARNWVTLRMMSAHFGYFVALMSMAKAVVWGVRGLLARSMRRNLTHRLHRMYCQPRQIALPLKLEVSAPDQRICDDAERITQGILRVGEVFLLAPGLIVWYSVRSSMLLSAASLGAIYAHFLISWLVLIPALKALKSITARKEEREALLRAEHVNIADQCESFAALGWRPLQALKTSLNFTLYRTLFSTKQFILTAASVEGLKSLFSYSGSLLCFALMAGEAAFGKWRGIVDESQLVQSISLTSYVVLYLIFQLGRLTGVVDELGVLNGQVGRLIELIDALEDGSLDDKQSKEDGNVKLSERDDILKSFKIQENVRILQGSLSCPLYSKSGKLLADRIHVQFGDNKHVLLCGPSGSGKTTLLSALSANSLPINWHCAPRSIYFSPQQPVLFTGSLLDLLGESLSPPEEAEAAVPVDEESPLPLMTSSSSDLDELARVRWALECAGLSGELQESLLANPNRVYSIAQWRVILTPGQHQRLALARALLSGADLVVLDETLSGGAFGAEEIGGILRVFEERGCVVVASAHNEAYASQFDRVTLIN